MYLDFLFTLPDTYNSPCDGYFFCSSRAKPPSPHCALATLRKIEDIIMKGKVEWEHNPGRAVGTYQPKNQDPERRREILRYAATAVYTGYESKFSVAAKLLDFMETQCVWQTYRAMVHRSYTCIMKALG